MLISDGNENNKKNSGLISKQTFLHAQQTFCIVHFFAVVVARLQRETF